MFFFGGVVIFALLAHVEELTLVRHVWHSFLICELILLVVPLKVLALYTPDPFTILITFEVFLIFFSIVLPSLFSFTIFIKPALLLSLFLFFILYDRFCVPIAELLSSLSFGFLLKIAFFLFFLGTLLFLF